MKTAALLIPICAFLFWFQDGNQATMDSARPGTLPLAEIEEMLAVCGVDDLDQLVGLEVLDRTFIGEVSRAEAVVQQRLSFARHLGDEVARTVVVRKH